MFLYLPIFSPKVTGSNMDLFMETKLREEDSSRPACELKNHRSAVTLVLTRRIGSVISFVTWTRKTCCSSSSQPCLLLNQKNS